MTTFFSFPSHAEELKILSHQQWLALDRENQELYLVGLRELIADFQSWQISQGIKFATADVGQWHFISKAHAETEAKDKAKAKAKACVYAGWVLTYQEDGKFCRRPPQGSCAAGWIQCQPLIFGEGVCTQPGRSATSICLKSAKSTSEVASRLKEKPEEWENYRQSMNSFCKEGRQQQVCHMIQSRLAQIQLAISGAKSSSTSGSNHKTTDHDVRKAATKDKIPQQQKKVETASITPAATPKSTGGRCNPLQLIADTGLPGDERKEPVLELAEAQSLACSSDPLSEARIQSRLSHLGRQLNRMTGKNDSTARYYSKVLTSLQANLVNCQENSSSAKNKIVLSAKYSGNVTPVSSGLVQVRNHRTQESWVTSSAHIAPTLGLLNLGLCDVEIPRLHHPSGSSPTRTTY